MKRTRPTAEQLERVAQAAAAARVAKGLPAVDPGDELHEQLQAERRARARKGKR